ncbi:MAG: 8-amino-7-oxononanoate synthase [Gemmataceae bacterium]|nr:8-amino-7-oxononanoate synthase [Gemmataceae bacterium]
MSLTRRCHAYLEELHRCGRGRRLATPAGRDFSSNDYLGYAQLAAATTAALARSGTASRLLRGHHPLWEEVETALARWHGAEAALVFTSGYTANEGLLSTVIEPSDWVASDSANHASIIDGLRLARAERFIFRHNDVNHLAEGLAAAAAQRGTRRELFIVTESLFGMDGDRAPLADIVALAQQYGAHVIIDEAHATGCFGPRGSGLVDHLGLRSGVLATVHTGGKALAVPGAYVVGGNLLRELLVNRCRHFIYTTALPPQVAAWWLETLQRAEADVAGRDRLCANALRFRRQLAAAGISAGGEDYIVPIVVGDDRAALGAATIVQRAGFDVRAIRPPTVPSGTARLRVSIHADHEQGELAALASVCAEALATIVPPLGGANIAPSFSYDPSSHG